MNLCQLCKMKAIISGEFFCNACVKWMDEVKAEFDKGVK